MAAPNNTAYPDFVVPYATGRSNLGKVKNRALKWPDFMKLFMQPSRTAETHRESFKLGVEEQTKLKNTDGFWLGGHSTDGRRKRTSIPERSVLTIDIEGDDFTPAMMQALVSHREPVAAYEWFLHSSRKHVEEKPRVRLVVPLTRPVLAEEYEATVRLFTVLFDSTLDSMDPVSARHSQMMFKPTASKDADYIFHHNRGRMLDPDVLLATWDHDFASLPYSEKHKKARKTKEKAEDPREKENFVGAFCRAYGIEEAMATFLPGLYEEVGQEGTDSRYTFLGGTTFGGVVVYDDTFAYSYHTHDPTANQLCNAFDLVRIHLFNDLDADVKEKTPPTAWPSYKAMVERFRTDPKVIRKFSPGAVEDMFEELPDEPDILPDAAPVENLLIRLLFGLSLTDIEPDTTPSPKKTKPKREPWPMGYMNAHHAVAQIAGNDTRILTFNKDGTLGYSDFGGINLLYAPNKMPTGNGGTETVAEYWKDHPKRRTYREGVVFRPEEDTEPDAYNLWRGFSVERDPDHTKCARLINHVYEVLADGNQEWGDYILDWSAHMLQRPRKKPGVAIALRGARGAGKDLYAIALGKMMRGHYVVVEKLEHLVGRFNAHEVQALLIHCPDVVWGGNLSAVGALNNLITGETKMIDRKHVDQFQIESFCRLFITGNEDWMIPAGADERRWAVFDVSEKWKQNPAYFDPLWLEVDGGEQGETGLGVGAFFDFLLERDLSGFDVRRFPATGGLSRQKERTLKGPGKFLYEMLMEGEIPTSPTTEDMDDDRDWTKHSVRAGRKTLYDVYSEWHRTQRFPGEISSPTGLGIILRHYIPSIQDIRTRAADNRTRVYSLPTLSICRAEFDRALGSSGDWPGEIEADDDLI